jgi:hypothetical protein
MSSLFTLLPLALMICTYAVLVKLAAFLFRRTNLKWKHALVFCVLVVVVGGGAAFLNQVSGRMVPLLVAIPVGVALQLALEGWYFGPRATTISGAPLEFKGGVLISLVAYAMVFAIGVLAAILLPMLPHAGQP